jgi:mRNA interferase HicA
MVLGARELDGGHVQEIFQHFSNQYLFLHLNYWLRFVVGNKFITFAMKSSELIRILMKAGWYIVRQKGSHLILRLKGSKDQITVPVHGSHEVGKGLQKKILKDAERIKKSQNEKN